MKKAICLFSGGKDSIFSVFCAMSRGFDVTMVTIEPEPHSFMFHHPNVRWTKLQAQAIALPHFVIRAPKEKELGSLEKTIAETGADAVFTGAVASDYQRQRIEQIGENLGIATYSPLWHKEKILMNEMLSYFEIYVVAVSAEGLGPEFLAKPFSFLVEKAPKNIHPFLEGGEGETFVANAPFFSRRIKIDKWKVHWDGVRGVAEIKNAHLA